MRVLMMEAPKGMLDERRRLGLDGRDEMWDGVLHVVPPAGGPHQRLSGAFFLVVAPLAQARGLIPHFETGLFDDEANYRVPDLLFCRSEHLSERGAEGADMVVEIRSPDDESYEKLDFYAAVGVREVLVLHPKGRRFELFRVVEGRLTIVSTDASGAVTSDVLAISLATVDGKLRITWPEGSADI
jgi:Uma2 family endonuclease